MQACISWCVAFHYHMFGFRLCLIWCWWSKCVLWVTFRIVRGGPHKSPRWYILIQCRTGLKEASNEKMPFGQGDTGLNLARKKNNNWIINKCLLISKWHLTSVYEESSPNILKIIPVNFRGRWWWPRQHSFWIFLNLHIKMNRATREQNEKNHGKHLQWNVKESSWTPKYQWEQTIKNHKTWKIWAFVGEKLEESIGVSDGPENRSKISYRYSLESTGQIWE